MSVFEGGHFPGYREAMLAADRRDMVRLGHIDCDTNRMRLRELEADLGRARSNLALTNREKTAALAAAKVAQDEADRLRNGLAELATGERRIAPGAKGRRGGKYLRRDQMIIIAGDLLKPPVAEGAQP